jgi:hypothetical protein
VLQYSLGSCFTVSCVELLIVQGFVCVTRLSVRYDKADAGHVVQCRVWVFDCLSSGEYCDIIVC